MSHSAPRSSPPVCMHMLGACAHFELRIGFKVQGLGAERAMTVGVCTAREDSAKKSNTLTRKTRDVLR